METITFDQQAAVFEQRAGLPSDVARQVASEVLRLGFAGNAKHKSLVEIGAGTGELGFWLSQGCDDYVGLDNSTGMLEIFRQRLATRSSDGKSRLLVADANSTWPLVDGSCRLIFGARVFHLLDVNHVLSETRRVSHPDGVTLLIGRVRRSRHSVKNQMRDKMRELIEEAGLQPRASEKKRQQLLDGAAAMGAALIQTVEVASWQVSSRPIDSIIGWQQKDSLGGITPPSAIREKILQQLLDWARTTFGDPEKSMVADESYLLDGFSLKAKLGEN